MSRNDNDKVNRGCDMETPASYTMGLRFFIRPVDIREFLLLLLTLKNSRI